MTTDELKVFNAKNAAKIKGAVREKEGGQRAVRREDGSAIGPPLSSLRLTEEGNHGG